MEALKTKDIIHLIALLTKLQTEMEKTKDGYLMPDYVSFAEYDQLSLIVCELNESFNTQIQIVCEHCNNEPERRSECQECNKSGVRFF